MFICDEVAESKLSKEISRKENIRISNYAFQNSGHIPCPHQSKEKIMSHTNLSPETIEKLKAIKDHFDQAEQLFNQISDVDNHAIFDAHNENYSLNHCVRWGNQACNDLLA